ncbi:class I SAM-dependent methyltransferase [Parabacteroides faecis]|uniref:SAM-dependent methyltransferase n=1 Tax=Parabacteroides faecis TaxID=1217282 RepID=A0ABR6KRZ0_9BACT|nr:methyltransferase domain-containing protein [Parabacteroides faecis]MBB4624205.1 SAM-dependent methyltransferase [Parabacteroides faecis]GGK12010.1 hypothetical protein GCM10007084_39220 [Parabacteroides faecis]
MKNKEKWCPTTLVPKKGGYRGNRDTTYLYVASRLVSDLAAEHYYSAIKKYAFGDLADVGCGYVPMYEIYKEQTETQTCIDWANTLHKNEYLDMECDLNQPLNIENDKFDTIILSDVLEHIRKPEHLLRELYRITRLDGVLILGVPFYYWLHETPFDYFRYTKYGLKSMLEDSGYSLIEMNATGGVLDVWGDLTAKIFARIPLIGGNCAKIVQYLIYVFGKTSLGKRIRKGTSESSPLSYIIVAKKVQ